MSRFSGALQLTDLDDFITPSQVILNIMHLQCHDYFAKGNIRIKRES